VEHVFSVQQTEIVKGGGLVEAVTNILAKPLGLMLADGPYEVAPVRTPLPFSTRLSARTMDSSGEIRIPILEENTPLGEIIMTDLPKTLDIGSAVEITLDVQENYQIVGRAVVRVIDREAKVVIDIPVPKRKSLDELKSDYVRLEGLAQDVKATANRGELFAKVGRLDKRLADCKKMLTDELQDLLKIQDCLGEIESLIREIGAGWRPQPPRANFLQKAAAADSRLAALLKARPELREDGYDRQLEAIRKEADEAYGAQSSATWQEANRRLEAVGQQLARLEGEAGGSGSNAPPPPDPANLVFDLGRGLVELERAAKANGRYAANEEEFRECAASLKKIDPKAPNAMSLIIDFYNTKYLPLVHKVTEDQEGGAARQGGFVGLEKQGGK
jgi:hypothetical protein